MDDDPDTRWLSPDEAFGVLGNEIRVDILQMLGEADGPVSFTDLRDRLGIRQGGQFNYHLDKLVGHFVAKTDEGYALRDPGRRVVEAILSGAVTGDPALEPTAIDFACHHCGSPVEVSYRHGTMRLSCTECSGHFDPSNDPDEASDARSTSKSTSEPVAPDSSNAACVPPGERSTTRTTRPEARLAVQLPLWRPA